MTLQEYSLNREGNATGRSSSEVGVLLWVGASTIEPIINFWALLKRGEADWSGCGLFGYSGHEGLEIWRVWGRNRREMGPCGPKREMQGPRKSAPDVEICASCIPDAPEYINIPINPPQPFHQSPNLPSPQLSPTSIPVHSRPHFHSAHIARNSNLQKISISRYYIQQMLKQEFQQIKTNAILNLCESPASNQSVIVQIYSIAVDKKDKLTCLLSDGNFYVKAFFKDRTLIKEGKSEFSIIRVKNHVVADSGKKLGIVDFELICEYNKLIGAPKPLDFEQMPNPEEVRPHTIELTNVTNKYVNMTQDTARKENIRTDPNNIGRSIKKEEVKIEEKREMRMPTAAKPLNGSVKDFETIKGLFVGLKGWHLLCRITKLDYQEFTKKNSDKLVKVLNIQLMDRSEIKISGVFFYQAAEKFRDELKLNSVYKISEGTISNQSYNNTKNDKISPFRLTFNINSVFDEVSDVNVIARVDDSAISLGELIRRNVFDQEFDILCVLVEIQEPKEIVKGDKLLKRWNWVVVDPNEEKKMYAVMWNDRISPDQTLIGKTVIMNRFSLHNYNGSLNLTSRVRSSVQLATRGNPQMEEKAMSEYKTYENLSDKRMKEEDNSHGTVYKNLKELNNAIQYLTLGETLRSDLNVWVSRLLTKKWFYQGCPSCNKAAEKGTNCHCGKYVQETIPHFIMQVELSDAFGSIYTTAYDEQAKRIFWDEEGVIHKLQKLEQQNQLKDVVEDYIYQQFKLRIYTKKDQQGRIKHNMGKLEHKIPQKIAQENVDRIRALMQEMMM